LLLIRCVPLSLDPSPDLSSDLSPLTNLLATAKLCGTEKNREGREAEKDRERQTERDREEHRDEQ
jgi:hypothetical protein